MKNLVDLYKEGLNKENDNFESLLKLDFTQFLEANLESYLALGLDKEIASGLLRTTWQLAQANYRRGYNHGKYFSYDEDEEEDEFELN